jgi:hypothetical protein
MKTYDEVLRAPILRRAVLASLVWLVALVGCAKTPRSADLTWVELVQLISGETVTIKRHVMMWHERAFGGGFSSAPIYKTSRIELSPGSADFPPWDAPLVPIVMDKDPANGDWIIVASIDECGMWGRNGKPGPPYWAFRLRNGVWYRDSLPEAFLDRAANLFVEYDVTDSSQEVGETITSRKKSQQESPKQALHYIRIERDPKNFYAGCGKPKIGSIGSDELDLKIFRTLR